MNSIDKNQPEKNHEDLQGPAAVAKIRELVDRAETCFFRTEGARPMNVRRVDDRGSLWFLAANDTHWVQELGAGGPVELFFQGSPHSGFLHLEGRASLSRDKAKIKELWEPTLNTWFTEGQDDPRIAVIEVAPTGGHYWDHKHGGLVAGVKMLIGAAVGVTLDDSIQGELKV
ncbi:pyridoxamine 5'-phosphate oxidase family protein [Paludisphaera soli]|uniref:pyridoxamine 5'-phosphate oxidase family protein n=1 Tax=Paludisphaera soli TaxID=2712865 RepID=UPI0013EC302A|nr:pyridoxamine 5'-phosphate oxidase family protein [Paludisphaera soli]